MAMELGLGLSSTGAASAAVAATATKKNVSSATLWSRIPSLKVNFSGRSFLGFGLEASTSSSSSFSSSSFVVRASSSTTEKGDKNSSTAAENSIPENGSSTAEKGEKKVRYPGENKGFVEEMRFVAMKLHTKDQSKEGEKEADVQPVGKWEPSIPGYLKFLVDSKIVYDTMEAIVDKAAHPSYERFRNTGLERAAKLAKDLEWFASQGHEIPEPGVQGTTYAKYLTEMSETDPPAFICHFYNVYFAHSAGGKFIGKKVAEMLIDGKELEFYKWDGELSQLLSAVKDDLNKVAEEWTREQKNHCLKETETSFKYSGKILRLIIAAE